MFESFVSCRILFNKPFLTQPPTPFPVGITTIHQFMKDDIVFRVVVDLGCVREINSKPYSSFITNIDISGTAAYRLIIL